MRKYKELFYSLLEYILAGMFIQGGVKVFFFSEPLVLPGIFHYLVGSFAIDLYGITFFLIGCSLLAGKWLKKKSLHKFSLLTMYLVCVYVLVLAIMLHGLGWNLLTTVLVGVTAAGLWMRWKFKTEYISTENFRSAVDMRYNDKN